MTFKISNIITKKNILVVLSILILLIVCFESFLLGQKYAMKKIAEISLSGTIQYDKDDEKLILDSARNAVDSASEGKAKYFLIVNRMIADWVVFNVYPLGNDFDQAQIYLKFNGGDPIVHGPATSFEGLSEQYPELFK